MHGITSLDGHGKASGDMNKAMERMSIVFKGRLSPEQLNQIKSDIQTTAMSGMAGEMLSAAGQGGDTMMAHMSPETIGMAQEMGILPQGQMNPMTGLPGFDDPTDPTDDDDPGPAAGVGAPSGVNDPGQGPADADLGATPEEEAAMAAMGNIAGVESPMNYAALYDKATKDMTNAEIAQARTYGLFNNEKSLSALATAPDKVGFVDAVANARHSQNPTMSQLDLNALTERGFQMQNPGISQAVGVAGTLAGLAVPGFGLATGIGNTVNALTGRPTLVDMALGTKAGDPLSGPTQAIADFARDSGLMSGIQSLVDAAGPAPTETAADVEMAEQGLGNENFVPDDSEAPSTEEEPAPEQFSEKAKLLGAGYSESDAQTILDNFGTLDTFQQRFEGRFGVPPTPAQLMEADKQQFINIRRGRPVGMGSGIGSLRT